MTIKNISYWRVTNLIALLITLILPWHVVCGDVITPQQFCLNVPGWESILISLQVNIGHPELLDYALGTLIDIGKLSLFIYILINCISVVTNNESPVFKRLLLSTVLLSILTFLQIFQAKWMTNLTWGYWLTCIVLVSSSLLEILELSLARQNRIFLNQNI